MKRLLPLLALLACALGHAQTIKVSALPPGTTPTGPDLTICVQSGTTNKCTLSQMLTYIQASLTVIGCPILGSTAGQICTSTGPATSPTFQSGTTYPGLTVDPSGIANTDLFAMYSQANSGLYSVTPNLLLLFVGGNSLASAASITPSCAYEDNFSTNTAGAGTFTVNAPTGCTPAEGQKLLLHIKFTNAQTYSWNAAFVGGTTALPTTSTGTSKGDWLAFRYDSINAKWDYLAAATGF